MHRMPTGYVLFLPRRGQYGQDAFGDYDKTVNFSRKAQRRK